MNTTCFTPPAFQSRVVPVIVLTDPAHAVPLAHALLDGGIDVMEITLRSSAALASIEAVAKAVPQMHVGAGTVTRVAEVQQVIDAGATFALSPGCTDARPCSTTMSDCPPTSTTSSVSAPVGSTTTTLVVSSGTSTSKNKKVNSNS